MVASLSADPQRTASTLRPQPDLFNTLSIDNGSGQLPVVRGRQAIIPPLGPDKERHLAQAKTVLLVVRASRGSPELLMVRAIDPTRPDRGRLTATINANYLWGDIESFPFQTAFCVLEGSHPPLFCSRPCS
jgi:hypothetical protein